MAIISAKSDTTVKPHAIYHNARRVTRLPSCRSPWLLGYAGDQGRHPDIKSTAQQMRSFDVILQPANEAPAHLRKPAGTGTFIVLPQHMSVHPTAERTEHRKRATQISSGGRAHCTPPPLLRTGAGDFPSKHSLPFPDRGPSSLGLVRSSKAVRLLLWGHPSATTGWRSSFLKLPVGGHILDTLQGSSLLFMGVTEATLGL